MTAKNPKLAITEIISAILRKGEVTQSKDIIEELSLLMDTISINKTELQKRIAESVQSKNFINAILSIFGLKVIKEENAIRIISGENNPNEEKDMLAVDEKSAKVIVERMATMIQSMYQDADEKYNDLLKDCEDLRKAKESMENDYRTQIAILTDTEKSVARNIQHIISKNGENATEANEVFLKLLEEMEITVAWSEEGADYSKQAMFKNYKLDFEEPMVPCLLRNGKIYLQGCIFTVINQ